MHTHTYTHTHSHTHTHTSAHTRLFPPALPSPPLSRLQGGGLALCDYLLEGEPAEAAADRGAELLALQGARVGGSGAEEERLGRRRGEEACLA